MDAHDALMEIENHADHTVKVKRAVNVWMHTMLSWKSRTMQTTR
jgi:hypothetical protein